MKHEDITKDIIGAAMAVLNELKPGLDEKLHENALVIELAARGHAVDKRADIWAFGCILYECLTGKKAFEGETVTETLAAVLRGDPDWNVLPAKAGTSSIRRRNSKRKESFRKQMK